MMLAVLGWWRVRFLSFYETSSWSTDSFLNEFIGIFSVWIFNLGMSYSPVITSLLLVVCWKPSLCIVFAVRDEGYRCDIRYVGFCSLFLIYYFSSLYSMPWASKTFILSLSSLQYWNDNYFWAMLLLPFIVGSLFNLSWMNEF